MKKHYHFIGIGGIGMGALASLLLAKEEKVSGSDLKENQVTRRLKKEGADVYVGHEASHIEGADFVIFSSAVKEDNHELKAAQKKRIPIIQRAKLLAQLMDGHISVTIAGAHGKTTTTSMASYMLMQAGLQPTTAVGGIVNGKTSNSKLGGGKYFVAEVDESDGSFLYFSPQYSIITNMDREHLDYYHNWENILKAYQEFIQRTHKDGLLIGCGDDASLLKLLKESKRKFIRYGFSLENDIYAHHIKLDNFSSCFDLSAFGKKIGPVVLNVPGKHNILNAMACFALGLQLSLDVQTILNSLEAFSGVQRRLQVKGQVDDIMVIDDYAHHPTEINVTLEAAKGFKKNRLIVVFQPHRYTRLQFLFKEFAQSLTHCDYLIVTDVYAASEKPIEGMTGENLVSQIKKHTQKPVVYLKKEHIIKHLLDMAKPGDLIITMGAGDITRLSDELVEHLQLTHKSERK